MLCGVFPSASKVYMCVCVCVFFILSLSAPVQSLLAGLLAEGVDSCQGLLPRHRKDFWPRFSKAQCHTCHVTQRRGFGCIVLAFTVTLCFSFCLCLSSELSGVHTSFEIVDWVMFFTCWNLLKLIYLLTFNEEIVWTQHVSNWRLTPYYLGYS